MHALIKETIYLFLFLIESFWKALALSEVVEFAHTHVTDVANEL